MAISADQTNEQRLVEAERLMRIPRSLVVGDGRKLCIRSWEPRVETGGIVSAKLEVLIMDENGEFHAG